MGGGSERRADCRFQAARAAAGASGAGAPIEPGVQHRQAVLPAGELRRAGRGRDAADPHPFVKGGVHEQVPYHARVARRRRVLRAAGGDAQVDDGGRHSEHAGAPVQRRSVGHDTREHDSHEQRRDSDQSVFVVSDPLRVCALDPRRVPHVEGRSLGAVHWRAGQGIHEQRPRLPLARHGLHFFGADDGEPEPRAALVLCRLRVVAGHVCVRYRRVSLQRQRVCGGPRARPPEARAPSGEPAPGEEPARLHWVLSEGGARGRLARSARGHCPEGGLRAGAEARAERGAGGERGGRHGGCQGEEAAHDGGEGLVALGVARLELRGGGAPHEPKRGRRGCRSGAGGGELRRRAARPAFHARGGGRVLRGRDDDERGC